MVIGLIPARYASKRFPGKLLADLAGKTVLQWTWQRCLEAKSLDKVVIAAGDEKIAANVRGFGADVIEIFKECSSGSDRIAKAVQELERSGEKFEIVVNIQGDEPLLDPRIIDLTVERLKSDPKAGVVTPVVLIHSPEEYFDTSVVKVVVDANGRALYFSRASIPYGFDKEITYKHIGLYAYWREVLNEFIEMTPCKLENTEQLEQLRLLYNGVKVAVVEVESDGVGIDTEEDLGRVINLITDS